MIERWRQVVGYEGFYEVSDLGRVRSLDRLVPHGRGNTSRILLGRYLRPAPDLKGYLCVVLSRLGVTRTKKVHQLVLEAFVGPRPKGGETRHYPDHDVTNNRLGNLSWCSPADNAQDRIDRGTSKWHRNRKHKANARHKTTRSA